MSKTTAAFSIDTNVLNEARSQNFNMSAFVEEQLRIKTAMMNKDVDHIDAVRLEQNLTEIEQNVTKLNHKRLSIRTQLELIKNNIKAKEQKALEYKAEQIRQTKYCSICDRDNSIKYHKIGGKMVCKECFLVGNADKMLQKEAKNGKQ